MFLRHSYLNKYFSVPSLNEFGKPDWDGRIKTARNSYLSKPVSQRHVTSNE